MLKAGDWATISCGCVYISRDAHSVSLVLELSSAVCRLLNDAVVVWGVAAGSVWLCEQAQLGVSAVYHKHMCCGRKAGKACSPGVLHPLKYRMQAQQSGVCTNATHACQRQQAYGQQGGGLHLLVHCYKLHSCCCNQQSDERNDACQLD